MLKIKDDVDLKELEKFGFKKVNRKELTHKACMHIDSKKEYYFEIAWVINTGLNTVEVLEERKNSDWEHNNKEREICIEENDYDVGIRPITLDLLYDLIKADLVEKAGE